MTMNYEKITVARFAERLKVNTYKSITAARRAIGKADWTEQERKKAHRINNQHFESLQARGLNINPSEAIGPPRVGQAKPQAKGSAGRKPLSMPPVASSLTESTEPTPPPATNAEMIAICGTANELLQTLNKAREIDPKGAAETHLRACEWQAKCMQFLFGRLHGSLEAPVSVSTEKRPRKLGNSVTPQTRIPIYEEDLDGRNARSVVGGS
jgi:hypothetical protein